MVSWSGWYRDRGGSERIAIANDGRVLTVRIRGVEFAGEDFDALEPVSGGVGPDSSFSLSGSCLCSCAIEWDVPVPVIAGGVRVDGVLRCELVLGDARGRHGGLDAEELTISLHTGGSTYTTERPHGLFELALEDIHRQLPADTYVMACITCAWSDYSPAGNGLFGSLACFRGVKDAYRGVRTKRDIFAIWPSRTEYVQETYLCPEFERRGDDAGYRGPFPGPAAPPG
jgi:hypothetical protein